MLYRLSAFLLISSSVVGILAQALASRFWEGTYLVTDHLIRDLGVTQCGQSVDRLPVREICSPGHDWFNYGTNLSGILLTLAGVLFLTAGERSTKQDTVAGSRPMGNLLIISGIALSAVGLHPFNSDPDVHVGAVLIHAAALWLAMIIGIRMPTQAPSHRSVSWLHDGYRGLTITLLVISVLGFLGLVVVGTAGITPGLFERLSFDVLSIWIIVVGVAVWQLPSLRPTAGSVNTWQHPKGHS